MSIIRRSGIIALGTAVVLAAKTEAGMIHHWHDIVAITWEADNNQGDDTAVFHPNDPAQGGAKNPEAGDTRHQHYDATPLVDQPSMEEPFSVSGVWVDRTFYRLPTAPYPIVPHGFIREWIVDAIPRYRFVGPQWERNADAMMAQPQIIEAFEMWSALQARKSPESGLPLLTGLEFMHVEADQPAEIDIHWGGAAGLGLTNVVFNPMTGIASQIDVRFHRQNNYWFFGNQADTPVDDPATRRNEGRFHFLSTALHEIGHVVGLHEQKVTDRDDVMILTRSQGPNGATTGPAFDELDPESTRGAYALYSIPIPEPSALTLAVLGALGVLCGLRRHHRR